MRTLDYTQIAQEIPPVWYTKEELKRKIPEVFLRIVLDLANAGGIELTKTDKLQKLTSALSSMSGIPVNQVEQELLDAASIFGRIEIFEEKFPEIVALLPLSETNSRVYPASILASVLGVTKEEALALTRGLFEDYSALMQAPEDLLN